MAALLPAAAAAAIPPADAISPADAPSAAPALSPAAPPSAAASAAPAASNVLDERNQRFEPVWSANGIVAAEQRQAMAVGAAVMHQGGNAVDAAVATAFAHSVTLPYAGNLGGGGFLLLWLPGVGGGVAAEQVLPMSECLTASHHLQVDVLLTPKDLGDSAALAIGIHHPQAHQPDEGSASTSGSKRRDQLKGTSKNKRFPVFLRT